jgi:hypothetical protein
LDYDLIDDETGDLFASDEYIMLTCDGKLVPGKSDENGSIKLGGLKLGDIGIAAGGRYGV